MNKKRINPNGFTLNQLIKRLENLRDAGHGRKRVAISKTTFTSNLEEDGETILPVLSVGVESIPQMDGDGGTKWNSDGSESFRCTIVFAGNAGSDCYGNILNESEISK